MKKLLFILTIMLGVSFGACARDNYTRDVKVLPKAALNMINNTFKKKVSLIKIDKSFGSVDEYEVVLENGTEIEFDAKGNWKSVETSLNHSVPVSLLPKEIVLYIAKNFKGQKVVGIKQKRSSIEIELSNDIDIIFDRQGNFLKYD